MQFLRSGSKTRASIEFDSGFYQAIKSSRLPKDQDPKNLWGRLDFSSKVRTIVEEWAETHGIEIPPPIPAGPRTGRPVGSKDSRPRKGSKLKQSVTVDLGITPLGVQEPAAEETTPITPQKTPEPARGL